MKGPGGKVALVMIGALLLGHVAASAASSASAKGERLFEFRADHMVLDAALVGSRVLVATQSGHLDAYDWRGGETGGPLHATTRLDGSAFPPTVTAVAVSHAGARCAVVSSDGLLALPLEEYQVGVMRIADGRILRRFDGHTGPVQQLLFTADGERLISADNDAWVFVWDLSGKSKGDWQ